MLIFLIIKFKIYVNGSNAYKICNVVLSNEEYDGYYRRTKYFSIRVGADKKIQFYDKNDDEYEHENYYDDEYMMRMRNDDVRMRNEMRNDGWIDDDLDGYVIHYNKIGYYNKLGFDVNVDYVDRNVDHDVYYHYYLDETYDSDVYLLSCGNGDNNGVLKAMVTDLGWEMGCTQKKEIDDNEYEIIIPYGEGCPVDFTAKRWNNNGSKWEEIITKGCNPSSSNDDDLKNCEGLYIYDNKLYECSNN